MAIVTVPIEVKLDQETKDLLARLPENLGDRIAEIERVLSIICAREELNFNYQSEY